MEPLNAEQQALASGAFVRASAIAERYAKNFPKHADDFRSRAAWAVVKAASSYKQDEAIPFHWWAQRAVSNELLSFLRTPDVRRMVAWDEIATLADAEVVDPEYFDSGWVDKTLSVLPHRMKALCDRVYKMDMTIEEAAVDLGYAAKYGHQMHKEAIKIMRKKLSA